MNDILRKGFDELWAEAERLEQESFEETSSVSIGIRRFVDPDNFLNWKVRVRNLLSKACGEDSQHFKQFETHEEGIRYTTNYVTFKSLRAIFLAAKKDFECGYLYSGRMLVQAEVFDSQLEQAEELLNKGYLIPAAVIAGTVLETALRELCDQKNIPRGKLNKMNADLAKAGAYNLHMQQEIVALAEIRNKAAHGDFDGFNKEKVANMIKQINQFLANEFRC